ncbi:hypothetical protein [Caulobacter hibisci]|uniref:Uncharacterized protein n=1 Tax=Caulobacter hibisci TaxID=2035993 RepID=A0ABS0T534_9CAUL|nr:hypothetical protein [Caulobacter hibisci]MBI1686205.1 hypothetical protein [Caulobacter hibisci]
MRTIMIAAAASLLACGAAQAQDATGPVQGPASDCLWSALPADARAEVRDAYGQGMPAATTALGRHDAEVKAAAPACIGRDGAPTLWIQFAAASAMIRDVSLQKIVAEGLAVTAQSLRAAWTAADPAARACFRVNAARVYGPHAEALLQGQTCPNPKVIAALVKAAGIDLADRSAASQAFIHFNAIAQAEFADSLLAMYREKAPAKGS